MTESSQYVIRGGVEGRERLRILSRVMHDSSTSLFDRLGLRDGLRCLDAGCGGGDTTLGPSRVNGLFAKETTPQRCSAVRLLVFRCRRLRVITAMSAILPFASTVPPCFKGFGLSFPSFPGTRFTRAQPRDALLCVQACRSGARGGIGRGRGGAESAAPAEPRSWKVRFLRKSRDGSALPPSCVHRLFGATRTDTPRKPRGCGHGPRGLATAHRQRISRVGSIPSRRL